MQYLSVGGALESPWERKSSRRIGYNDGGLTSSKSIHFTGTDQINDGQSEFGFIDPSEVDRSSQLPSNHLDLNHEEPKPKRCDHMKVQSRITPTRLNVVRNDLLRSDLGRSPNSGPQTLSRDKPPGTPCSHLPPLQPCARCKHKTQNT